MKVLLALTVLTVSTTVLAADKKYFVAGVEKTAAQATLASLRGEGEVYKCTAVQAKASKSGSISLKTKED